MPVAFGCFKDVVIQTDESLGRVNLVLIVGFIEEVR